MSGSRPLGPLVHSFFLDHLVAVKGLRPATVRSYRDTVRLLLCFVAQDKKAKITRLGVEDLSLERVLGFLRHLEEARGNHVRTRNQRLAALHILFDNIARREPEMLGTCQQVAAIPMKRAAPAATHFLELDEIEALFRGLPRTGRLALRDRALILFLYNTGARVQEVADLRVGHLEFGEAALVRLHGKGDKWRTCPLWRQTATLLTELLDTSNAPKGPEAAPVFRSTTGGALTRFGIYKIVRRHTGHLDDGRTGRLKRSREMTHLCSGEMDRRRLVRGIRASLDGEETPLPNLPAVVLSGSASRVEAAGVLGGVLPVGEALADAGVVAAA